MEFKTYVQSVVASYVEKQNKNVIFIKHYNTLDITKEEILARVEETGDKVFLYHEYAMHEMHQTFAPFLQWISRCYHAYYEDKMTAEEFLRACQVYSMHVEPLAGFLKNNLCVRNEDVLHFEIQFESIRMQNNILNILDYISKEHHLIMILSKLHLAPYSTICLLKMIVDKSLHVHAILMYNDEFNIADYKKDVWNDLLQTADEENLQLEWGSLSSERTMDVQDEFWFDQASSQDYLLKLRNMFYTFSLQDAEYYLNNILNRLDEKTIWLKKSEIIPFLMLAALTDMSSGHIDHALVLCDKLTDMQCHQSADWKLRYMYYYICARARMIVSQTKAVKQYCDLCINLAEQMHDSFLVCKSEVILLSTYCGMCKNVFEYDFSYQVDLAIVEKLKKFGFRNFLAYLYVFGFENDEETIEAIAGGQKPYYFDLGIEIGTELGNDNFLMNAYMKNIILYSRAGYHRYVREMYEKRLRVLRRPNPLREAHMLAGLGYNSIILEDYAKAHSYLMRSVLTLTNLEKPDDTMNSLYNLAMNSFVAEDYQNTIYTIELVMKILKEMGYSFLSTCSMVKLYSLIAISCYYQKEYYNCYYFLSKMEIHVEHMITVLQASHEGIWDEDLLLYHLVKGMLYNYENNNELCQEEFDKVNEIIRHCSGSLFFVIPIFAVEQASLYLKLGQKDKADETIRSAIAYCEEEELFIKKGRLQYFLEHGERQTEPIVREDNNIPVEHILQSARQAGTQIKLTKREKDIKFLTVLQEAISRENMSVDDLFFNTSAVIKNSYNLDEIIILRRQDGKTELMRETDAAALPEEAFDEIFNFFYQYKQAFLSNRVDKNFTQFYPVMKHLNSQRIMTIIGIPIMEASGTETIFLGSVRIKRPTMGNRSYLNHNDLMILKFAFSQFCEMMRRIDSRLMIERMNRQLEQSAITDHLTGITNRNGFSRQAEIICSQGSGHVNALLYLDLDNFKYYNDTFGHDVGDLVLVTFAEIFKSMTKNKGLAVRYGGDEFIILLYDQTAKDAAHFADRLYETIKDGFVERIREKLNMDIHIPDNKKISCSIGITEFPGGSKDALETAVHHADQMLYDVKRNGKSYYKLYNDAFSSSENIIL